MVSKRITKNIKVSPEHKEKLERLAQRSKVNQKLLAEYLIDICEKFDLYKSGFEERLVQMERKFDELAYDQLNERCPALAHTTKDGFVCLIKPPRQQKLGNGNTKDMGTICSACERVTGIKTELTMLRAQVKKGATVKMPYCQKAGSRLKDNGKMYCVKDGETRSLAYCQKNCDMLSVTNLTVKGELKDWEKNR